MTFCNIEKVFLGLTAGVLLQHLQYNQTLVQELNTELGNSIQELYCSSHCTGIFVTDQQANSSFCNKGFHKRTVQKYNVHSLNNKSFWGFTVTTVVFVIAKMEEYKIRTYLCQQLCRATVATNPQSSKVFAQDISFVEMSFQETF